jgi:uridine kinase
MIEIPQKLIEEITARKDKKILLIAVDGCGGAGKSMAAVELAYRLGYSQVVRIDDFYKTKEKRVEITDQIPVHSNFEFERLKQQVLQPLGRLFVAKYQTSDGKELEVQPNGFVIVEGLGTLGEELRDHFDYKIWVDSPESKRRQRGIERDTEGWTEIWDTEYLPQDARYVKEQAPQNQADWILSNS